MGIPKCYRYLAERWPLINQAIDESTLLPAVDCLYLDTNGLIVRGGLGVRSGRATTPTSSHPHSSPSQHNATHADGVVSKGVTIRDVSITILVRARGLSRV